MQIIAHHRLRGASTNAKCTTDDIITHLCEMGIVIHNSMNQLCDTGCLNQLFTTEGERVIN